jgi:hypothetical protein
MRARALFIAFVATIALAAAAIAGTARTATAATPNAVEQWNKIAEDTVVGSGAFQNEGLIYMGYVSAAVYDAVASIQGGYSLYGPALPYVPKGASADAAAIEAGYRTLLAYYPSQAATLTPLYLSSMLGIAAGPAKTAGEIVGLEASDRIVALRSTDKRVTTLTATSTFPTSTPGPGVWRLTPPAFLPPQTPWVANVKPFVMQRDDQFLPPPPPALSSTQWSDAFSEIKSVGAANSATRTPAQTSVALFWTANVIRQYNRLARDVADARGLDLLQTARLVAMVNVVGADAQIAVMNAKYHYLFWRPVTAIDPSAVTNDGFGTTPGVSDGNPATAEQTGWRPLVATPNHPEYPAAHGSFTSAEAEIFSTFLGSGQINVDIHGFDPAGPAGNLNVTRHFNSADDLRADIVNARLWAGVHYRFSGQAGVALGQSVAQYDLKHAFLPSKKH